MDTCKRIVSLIGMPGSGKTTVGRQLARRLGLDFVDSDRVIEERLGCSIRAFFEREGEDAFRALEEATLDELTASGASAVLSTGGGAVLRPATRERLRRRSQVVYLHALADDIYRRLRHDTTRPLLQTEDPLQQLRNLYAQRDPLYREAAHFVIETGRPSVATLVNMVVMQLELAGTLNAGALIPASRR
ncbi:MAG: shikimate kinase [Burkholderiaceae bacterium]|jgi:shikimate kinase|nr:shikimate kinase [Burkholderiaceae bacterium]MCO5102696.1 shikimate kinase [Burkholderiaceae bacterium]